MSGTTMVDTSVFGALNRAQSGPRIARDLLALQAEGKSLVVCSSTYQEILNTPDAGLRAAQLQQIEDFHMRIQSPVSAAQRVDLYVEYSNVTVDKTGAKFMPQRAGVELKDLPHIGDVRAYMKSSPGESVELFTVERMSSNKVTVENAYSIKLSAKCRVEANMGARAPYDPEALGVRSAKRAPPAAEEPIPSVPETPLPEPGPGATETFMKAARRGFKEGLKALWSIDTVVQIGADLFLWYADRVAAKDAMRKIQIKFVKEGFAKGVAAGVMGWSEAEVASDAMNRVTYFRVQGMGDAAGILTLPRILRLAEAAENYAVGFGYYFSVSRSPKWKEEMRAKGFKRLVDFGYRFGDNEDVLFEYDFLSKLAWALRRETDAIVRPAIRTH